MIRIELNCVTGEAVEVEQVAYVVAGSIVVLDASADAPDGAVLATPEQISEIDALPAPSALEQIRAIERTPEVSDAMQRGSRMVALAYALDEVMRIAAGKGISITREQAHVWAMANDANYHTLFTAEQTIKPLRPLV
jgi:hypothetical protein